MGNQSSALNPPDEENRNSAVAPETSNRDPPKAPANVSGGAVGPVLGRPLSNIRDRYIIDRELGRGQFGVTRLVIRRDRDESLACKSIASRKIRTKKDAEIVRREVAIMHHLTGHRNIVELVAAYEDRQHVNLVMELCEGGELFDRIIAKGHYSEKDAAMLFRQIVMVVHVCHSMGVMHRDLKPENFLFLNKNKDSPLKAIDFGLSTFFKPGEIYLINFFLFNGINLKILGFCNIRI